MVRDSSCMGSMDLAVVAQSIPVQGADTAVGLCMAVQLSSLLFPPLCSQPDPRWTTLSHRRTWAVVSWSINFQGYKP